MTFRGSKDLKPEEALDWAVKLVENTAFLAPGGSRPWRPFHGGPTRVLVDQGSHSCDYVQTGSSRWALDGAGFLYRRWTMFPVTRCA